MNNVMMWVLCAIAGMGLNVFGGVIGGSGIVLILLGSFLMLYPIINVVTVAKDRNVLPMLSNLKKHEKMVFYILNLKNIIPVIFNSKDEGILEKDKLGMLEDKGTPLFWGKIPVRLALSGAGVTLDVKDIAYTGALGDNRDIRSYEDAIKKYLGPKDYISFEKKYRVKNRKPDWAAIKGELQYLLKQEPHDPLAEVVAGEQVDFRYHLNHLLYAYDPMLAKNAVDRRVMAAEQQNLQYKNADKAMGYAKAFAVVMIVIVIFLVAIQNVDFGKILGGFGF